MAPEIWKTTDRIHAIFAAYRIQAIFAGNRIQAIFDNKKLTPETKMTALLILPIQLWNINNNIYSSRKHHQCISEKTTKNIYVLNVRYTKRYTKEQKTIEKNTAIQRWLKLSERVIRADDSKPTKKAINNANTPGYEAPGDLQVKYEQTQWLTSG